MNDFMNNKNLNKHNNNDSKFDSKFETEFDTKMQSNVSIPQEKLDGGVQIDQVENEILIKNHEIVEPQKNKKPKPIVIIISVIFIIAGIFMLYLGFSFLAQQLKYEKVDATVISVRTYINEKDSTLMAVPTYEYYVNGVRYEVEDYTATSANDAPTVGDKVIIHYNPENPKEIMTMEWTLIVFFVMGVIFSVLGVTVLIQALRGKWQ